MGLCAGPLDRFVRAHARLVGEAAGAHPIAGPVRRRVGAADRDARLRAEDTRLVGDGRTDLDERRLKGRRTPEQVLDLEEGFPRGAFAEEPRLEEGDEESPRVHAPGVRVDLPARLAEDGAAKRSIEFSKRLVVVAERSGDLAER